MLKYGNLSSNSICWLSEMDRNFNKGKGKKFFDAFDREIIRQRKILEAKQ